MVERRRTRTPNPEAVVAEVQESIPTDSKMKQVHKVHVGDSVTLNGTLYNIASGKYAWEMACPEGSQSSLMNPTMPGPSFIPDMEGEYIITLPTDEGIAEVKFEVDS